MSHKRIFVTGASGCIGHYIVESLIQNTQHELFLLVRNPEKLKVDYKARSGVNLLTANLREIERFSDLLSEINVAILIATAWGNLQEVFDINVVKTIKLVKLLNPEVCENIIYFSTASILDSQNKLLRKAGEIGTDYIRSKYDCMYQLSRLKNVPPLTCLFPTLVLGGDDRKPYSHLSSGLPEIIRYIGLIRWLKADGSFHFIHAEDIARVVTYLVENPPQSQELQKLVLGNTPVTVNQAITEICAYLKKRIYFQFNLSPWLIELIIVVFQIQIAAWDRFCLEYRHFTYQNPVNPATFKLPISCPTLADILRTRDIFHN
ncbi:MAG: NAD(P)-dependent oxidoreductase [Okeania sp. SIO2G4]|uniref:NAD-dependent epimerase/dehydratase family protein n=1 Tax=unclassified Okeania TaxID=2634635 RepID=UPI0013B9FC6E|nr:MULTISPECIES: NAD(P)-dependent oxidoreductase [unclassified Okeania]NEP03603.1 NAD(P)-dependent oxidoreductase [Okeania sp. SIO4D6]NEP40827.1 NAD(P)-dependent oxidoreductase [Okeania sp. SIO2H7]NEP72737.1 NAD(P)-dependent oxidoreductase [Okeania sp. SIO2G5]NEP93371.1 NAD(P)-dependent oxidoreductase [Okeania sp. SIO2F5]NEQ91383.1 NAD(P)-dependent oxidoreductase [Okeania sp. SIO2G4]